MVSPNRGMTPKELIRVFASSADTLSLVPQVRQHADLEKDALGFLPSAVYDEAAKKGNLLVAAVEDKTVCTYAGHILWGGKFPHARIYQLHVAPKFRRQGVARALVHKLVEFTEAHSYLSISARVAADLLANQCWENLGFEIAGFKAGGSTRNRTLNVRVRQLRTLDLFSQSRSESETLGLVDKLATRQPVYVIDLNVFWDVTRQRPRTEYATQVISAALHHLVQVVVTAEFINELSRTSRPSPTDPALEFAIQLPVLPLPERPVLDALVQELGRLVFPDKAKGGILSARDLSDLAHLSTAIHHSANAFVTSENAMIQAGGEIARRFGLEVLHVQEFSTSIQGTKRPLPSFRAQLSSNTLQVWELIAENSSSVESFLKSNSAACEYREDFLAVGPVKPRRKKIAVTSEGEIVCLASWDANAGLQPRATIRLIADEEHPAVEAALGCALGKVCAEASAVGPVLLRLETPPGHVVSRKIAITHGFQPSDPPEPGAEAFLHKLCVGRPITNSNWQKTRSTLRQCSGLSFPETLPSMDRLGTRFVFETSTRSQKTVALSQIEKLLSPTLIIVPGRKGSIVPIRRHYAEQLLETSAQLLLAPNREAVLFSERVYFSAARNARILLPGSPLLFYESGGTGGAASVTAAARIVTTEVYSKAAISADLLRHGVIDSDELANLTATDSIAVTTFDNVMALRKPVRLDRLRQLGCVDGSNLVTAKEIDHTGLLAIVEEGFGLV